MRRRLPPVLRRRDYALFWCATLTRALATQMVAVAVGWQVYAVRERPFDLGLVGLAEFVPLLVLALPAGHLSDRFSRRIVLVLSTLVSLVTTAMLLALTVLGPDAVWPFLLLAAGTGAAAALGNPAGRSLPPELVPATLLAPAMALRSIAGQTGIVAGPALGGLLFAVQPELVYAVALALFAAAASLAATLHRRGGWTPRAGAAPGLAHVLGGIAFLRRSRIVLGAIMLDLFAVLLGGAVALLPVFARTILHVGPTGLGILRSAPAAGALVAGVLLTRRPLGRRAGTAPARRRRALRREHRRLRALPLLPPLGRRPRRQRLRRHVQHQHQDDDRGARDPERAARPRQRGRDGVRQRVERAGCVRVRRRRGADRHRAGGRGGRRRNDRDRRPVDAPVPGPGAPRPARGAAPGRAGAAEAARAY